MVKRSLVVICVMFLLASVMVTAQEKPKVEDGLAPFGWFANLAGACWVGTYPDGRSVDKQCYETQYNRYLRGTATVKGDSPDVPNHDGEAIFAWDKKAGKITFWFWADTGAYGTGEAYFEGDVLRFPSFTKADPSKPQSRTSWVRIDGDSFKVSREKREGEIWREVLSIVYKRTPLPSAGVTDPKKP